MKKVPLLVVLMFLLLTAVASAAYHHNGDTDSDIALQAYPAIEGTKLDSCALCHSGGSYEKKPGVFVELGSCQWCHYAYGYDESGNINETLNGYGMDYKLNGKSLESFSAIEQLDSDTDGYTNKVEIAALRFPGDENDDPSKVPAPYKVVSIDEMAAEIPYHAQTMLMNTHKSGDFYTEYGGVTMADLLDYAGILDTATGITVYAPDGWAQYHPLDEDSDPLMYHVYGEYPAATFFYDIQADSSISGIGWCDYSSEAVKFLHHEDAIVVENGLQMMLAYTRDGEFLEAGTLTPTNKLDGEGPFRVVPPQKLVGPPDQASTFDDTDVKPIWPFDNNADHNAGFSTRSATIIKIEPLPEGTTDIDTLEAGWDYVDEGKILIYGAIDPLETILGKLSEVNNLIQDMDCDVFRPRPARRILLHQIDQIVRQLNFGHDRAVSRMLEKLANQIDGCATGGAADRNDKIKECDSQTLVYWPIHDVRVLHGD